MKKTIKPPKPQDLQILEVCYRQTFNTGNYTSETIELRAKVEPNDSAEEVLLLLKQRVFLASRTGKALIHHANVILSEGAHSDLQKTWARAVVAGKETRPWATYKQEVLGV